MPKTSRVLPYQSNNTVPVSAENQSGWDDLSLDDHIRALLYGQPATGKTSTWATFPGPISVLVCSGGKRAGELRSVNTPSLRAKIRPKMIRRSEEAFVEMSRIADKGDASTIVLDHISGLQTLMAMEVLNLKEAPLAYARSNAQVAKGMTLVSQQEWGFISVECMKLLRTMFSLPCHAVVVGQQREFKPREDSAEAMAGIGQTFIGIGVIESLARDLNQAADYILRTFIRPKYIEKRQESKGKSDAPIITRARVPGQFEYCCLTGPHDLYITKFRVPKEYSRRLPECVVNLTFDKIMALSRGEAVSDE